MEKVCAAKVVNGIVENVAVFEKGSKLPNSWVLCDNRVAKKDLFDGSTFIKPAE